MGALDLQATLKARGYDCGGPGFWPQTRAQLLAALEADAALAVVQARL